MAPSASRADVRDGSPAPQGEGDLLFPCRMGRQEPPEGKIGEDVAVVDEDRLVLIEQVLDVLQPPGGVEEDRFMAEEDRPSPPAPLGKGPVDTPLGSGGC